MASTRREGLSSPARLRRISRAAAFAGAGALVLAGAGAAAAGWHWHWHSPWADHAVARLDYTVPSGAECEETIGGFTGPADTIAAAERYARGIDIASVVDLAAAYEQVQITSGDGSELPRHDRLNDIRCRIGAGEAVHHAIVSERRRQGLPVNGFRFEGEEHCAGDTP